MIQETIYALEVLPPPFLKYFYLFIILFAHMLIFSRGSIVLLSFLVFCQISKNVPFIFCYVFLIVFLHLIIHSSIGKICIFEISFYFMIKFIQIPLPRIPHSISLFSMSLIS